MGEIIDVGKAVRVESGPVLKTAIATPGLLNGGGLAPHYKPGRADAKGKPIVIGQEFQYLDWYGEHEWKIYRFDSMGIDRNGVVILPGEESGREAVATDFRWIPVGAELTKTVALEKARALAGRK